MHFWTKKKNFMLCGCPKHAAILRLVDLGNKLIPLPFSYPGTRTVVRLGGLVKL